MENQMKGENCFGFSSSEDTVNTNKEKKHQLFLGSVPKAEAERLVTVATKLYVTTEMLLNRKCHTKQIKKSETAESIKSMVENFGEVNIVNSSSLKVMREIIGNKELTEGSPNKESMEENTNSANATLSSVNANEIETVVREIHVPDIRSEVFYQEDQKEEGLSVNHVVENENIKIHENDLPVCKLFKDASSQTEKLKDVGEEWYREQTGESDKESGVHVFSYSSNAHRNFYNDRKYLDSSSSPSLSMSEDSNYCDDTCSDEEHGCVSSEMNSLNQPNKDKLETIVQPSLNGQINGIKNSPEINVVDDSTLPKDDLSHSSDSEGDSSEMCSTCYSETSSCNSCSECQGKNIFVITKVCSSDYSQNSTHSCSCPSDECSCNEKGIDYEEQNNLNDSNEDINPNADLNNNTVVATEEENEDNNKELMGEKPEGEGAAVDHKELIDEEAIKHQKVMRQMTTESVDSEAMDEEMQILSIHKAAKEGNLQVVELLSKVNRKYIETVDERGWTPIHLAAANGCTEIVKFLALEGAHISALDPSGYTALHIAAMKGHKECMEALLQAEADVESITSDGFTSLHLAALNNHVGCCKILLAWGASLKKEDALGRTVVDMAEEYSLKRVKKLLQKFNKQLESLNTIVETMDAFSGKKHSKSEKPLPINVLQLLTSVMTDEHSSD